MDVNDPPDPARNAARLRKATEALAFDFFFTTDPAKPEPLPDHLSRRHTYPPPARDQPAGSAFSPAVSSSAPRASARRAFALPGRSGFCCDSCGAQPVR